MARKTVKVGDDPNHPSLKLVQEALAKNPDLSGFFLCQAYGVGYLTLKAWKEHGWIATTTPKKDNASYKWGKIPGPHRPYDINMVKVKK